MRTEAGKVTSKAGHLIDMTNSNSTHHLHFVRKC